MHWALFTSGNLFVTSNLSIAAGESFGALAMHFKFDNDSVFDRHVDIIRGLVNAGVAAKDVTQVNVHERPGSCVVTL